MATLFKKKEEERERERIRKKDDYETYITSFTLYVTLHASFLLIFSKLKKMRITTIDTYICTQLCFY